MPLTLPPGAGVDDRIHPVEEAVAKVHDVALRVMNVDIRIGVRRLNVPELDGLTIGLHLVRVLECLGGPCGRRNRGEMHPQQSCDSDKRLAVFSCARMLAPA
jgi:hypothetical protein